MIFKVIRQPDGRNCGLYPAHFLAIFMQDPVRYVAHCKVCAILSSTRRRSSTINHAFIQGEVPILGSLADIWGGTDAPYLREDAREAIASMARLYRVFVRSSGLINSTSVFSSRCALEQRRGGSVKGETKNAEETVHGKGLMAANASVANASARRYSSDSLSDVEDSSDAEGADRTLVNNQPLPEKAEALDADMEYIKLNNPVRPPPVVEIFVPLTL